MSAPAMEAFLARLYTDHELRRAFLAAPAAVARSEGLNEASVLAMARIDRDGLQLAAQSYAGKRAAHGEKSSAKRSLERLLRRLGTVLRPTLTRP